MRKKAGYISAAILLTVFVLLWFGRAWKGGTGYAVTAVETEDRTFTATFDTLYRISVCSGDVSLYGQNRTADLTVVIRDSGGKPCGTLQSSGAAIHADGYSDPDQTGFRGFPVQLEAGGQYTLECTVTDDSGIDAGELTFLLYGRQADRSAAGRALMAAAALLLLGCMFFMYREAPGRSGADGYRTAAVLFTPVFFLLLLLYLPSVPMFTAPQERSAFAQEYALSNAFTGRPVSDTDGLVYVDESGIRFNDSFSYGLPLDRFWFSGGGSVRMPDRVSALYSLLTGTDPVTDLLCVPGALLLSLLRLLKAPYQAMMLSVRILHAVLTWMIACFAIRTCLKAGRPRAAMFAEGMFLLPSVMTGALSYTGSGILLALCTLYAACCLQAVQQGNAEACAALPAAGRRYARTAILLLAAAVFVRYDLAVLLPLFLAIPDGCSVKGGRAEKKLSAAAVCAEAAVLFLYRQGRLAGLPASAGGSLCRGGLKQWGKAVLNTLFMRGDVWFRGSVVNAFFIDSRERILTVVILLFLLLYLRSRVGTGSRCRKVAGGCRGSGSRQTGGYTGKLAAAAAGGVLLLLTETVFSSQGGAEGTLIRGITGADFLPYLLLPFGAGRLPEAGGGTASGAPDGTDRILGVIAVLSAVTALYQLT
ncbi:MAG: hypothetical protein LKJ76_00820 [Lachnospiraceae bacterium]|jgi:hypothetical protein|nr:hypothetical protein [Lachnospiraceae bacterium]